MLPARAESCSAMTITAAGDDLTALWDKAFTAFKDTCRRSKMCQEYGITSEYMFMVARIVSETATFFVNETKRSDIACQNAFKS